VLGIAVGDLVGSTPPHVPGWTSESGSGIGWLALLTCGAAGACFLREQANRPSPLAPSPPEGRGKGMLVGFFGLALLAQLACTVAAQSPDWAIAR